MRRRKRDSTLKKKDVETILAFAGNSMRYKPSAAELGVHFETVSRRLDSIYRRTLLNPKDFYDLAKIVQQIECQTNNVKYIDADLFVMNMRAKYCECCDSCEGEACKICWVEDMLSEIDAARGAD